jgi:hypothetical protein
VVSACRGDEPPTITARGSQLGAKGMQHETKHSIWSQYRLRPL